MKVDMDEDEFEDAKRPINHRVHLERRCTVGASPITKNQEERESPKYRVTYNETGTRAKWGSAICCYLQ